MQYVKEFFPGWSHSADPSCASSVENGSIYPQWHHTTCGHQGANPTSNHEQWLKTNSMQHFGLLTERLVRSNIQAIRLIKQRSVKHSRTV